MADPVHHIVADDFARLNQSVIDRLASRVSLIESIGHYIVEAGGKRMRPTLVLLTARACGYRGDDHIKLATVIEFIHTATLLHDDVVDMSEMRRGRPTANVRWDNPSSVLVGDFIYSRAFELLVELGDMNIMDVMASTTNRISEGEVLQLINQHNSAATEADYLQVITNKTAILFAAACRTAGLLSGMDEEQLDALHDFGLETGMAFQLVDDVLDYDGSSEEMGKNVGDDLAEGKPTLPLIHTLQHGPADGANMIREAIQEGGLTHLDAIIDAVRSCGALDYTMAAARERVDRALVRLEQLPAGPYRDGMAQVARTAMERRA